VAEAQRLERTRPKDPRKRFAATEEGQEAFDRWLAGLPRGDRVICNVIVVPDPKKPHRKRYHATRVVDRKIWAKLDGPARGRYIERIRQEVIGA
jgi:DNA-binding PadR family transcriptional regulator